MSLSKNDEKDSNQQQSLTDNEQHQAENTNIELLPIVEDHVKSHDALAVDNIRSHDTSVAENSDSSVGGISYRQLLQQDDNEYNGILENEALDSESEVSGTEPEDESRKALQTKQGMGKKARNAFVSTLTVTMAILR